MFAADAPGAPLSRRLAKCTHARRGRSLLQCSDRPASSASGADIVRVVRTYTLEHMAMNES
jgi:hypothetical protein